MKVLLKIAVQGGRASFHHLAAQKYFSTGKFNLHSCATFRQLCEKLLANQVHYAVMAIENTLVGSILPNYSLLQEYPLHITGETYLHIEQNLMALPEQSITDIHLVRSHPMALLQCSQFLEQHPQLKSMEAFDTAESAREIRQRQLRGVAAIASRQAAKLYDLQILARDIENQKQNYTRFLVLAAQPEANNRCTDKASIHFRVHDEVGALARVLNILAEHQVNLTLIQSIPIPDCPHQYAIHVDVRWQQQAEFQQALRQIKKISREVKILGLYKSGVKPYDHPGR
ncbi:MAG: prephenate dehydratase [bacterium]